MAYGACGGSRVSKILCICEMGNNRSVTAAHQLKYLGHDCIP
jgi:hypothetical protein